MTRRGRIDPATSEQALAERASRLARVWREDEPDASEIAAARLRSRGRGVTRGRSRAVPLAIAFAVMLGGAGALAGGKVLSQRARHQARTAEAPTGMAEADVVPANASPRAAAGHAVPADLLPSPESVESPAESPPVAPAAASAPTPPASPAPRPASHAVPPPSPAVASTESRAANATWSAAADAMRSGDYAGAGRAFDELARSPDVRTRDEARLARAQVLAAGGHVERARAELQSLAAGGATALVRARAADALRALAAPLTAPATGN